MSLTPPGRIAMAGKGYYCEDCDVILDARGYAEHNADHTLRRITWQFERKQS